MAVSISYYGSCNASTIVSGSWGVTCVYPLGVFFSASMFAVMYTVYFVVLLFLVRFPVFIKILINISIAFIACIILFTVYYFSFLKNLSTYRFQEKFNLSFALGSGVRSQNPRKSSV
jgi:hypothetical protein